MKARELFWIFKPRILSHQAPANERDSKSRPAKNRRTTFQKSSTFGHTPSRCQTRHEQRQAPIPRQLPGLRNSQRSPHRFSSPNRTHLAYFKPPHTTTNGSPSLPLPLPRHSPRLPRRRAHAHRSTNTNPRQLSRKGHSPSFRSYHPRRDQACRGSSSVPEGECCAG